MTLKGGVHWQSNLRDRVRPNGPHLSTRPAIGVLSAPGYRAILGSPFIPGLREHGRGASGLPRGLIDQAVQPATLLPWARVAWMVAEHMPWLAQGVVILRHLPISPGVDERRGAVA